MMSYQRHIGAAGKIGPLRGPKLAGVFAPDWVALIVLLGGLGVIVIWAVLYSLYWYRRLGSVDDLSPGGR